MTRLSQACRDACAQAIDRGYAWYASQQESDGSLGTAPSDEATYYNTLYALASGGRWRELHRFAEWAESNIIDSDRTLCVDHDGIFAACTVYLKGWYIFGSHCCGRYQTSLAAIDSLLSYQDSGCGGFFVSRRARDAADGLIEHTATSIAGLACLATGALPQARAAGDFLVEFFRKQPDIENSLYGYLDPRNGELITVRHGGDSPVKVGRKAEAGQDGDIDVDTFHLDNQSDQVQGYATVGVPLSFLCHLHRATGEKAYLDSATMLSTHLLAAGDKCWVEGQSTKALWGLVLLHDIAGDPQLLDAIEKLINQYCRAQLPNGAWISPIGGGEFADQAQSDSLALAGDFLLSLAAALRYLG